jgi:asparagine synthetase B (glutamine-hydrolysing)
LLHWEDRNSMAAGTEARLPFLDHRVVEAVLSTSAWTKLKNGFTKYSLRCAMDGLLPAAICWQKKKRGFETPARQWFKTDLAPQVKELLSQRDGPLSEFFEMDRLLAQFKVFEKRNNGCLTENEWFKVVGTSIWLEQLKSSSRRSAPEAALAVQ